MSDLYASVSDTVEIQAQSEDQKKVDDVKVNEFLQVAKDVCNIYYNIDDSQIYEQTDCMFQRFISHRQGKEDIEGLPDNPNDLNLVAADHYSIARQHILNRGENSYFTQVKTHLYFYTKSVLEALNSQTLLSVTDQPPSPASREVMEWGLKGVYDARAIKHDNPTAETTNSYEFPLQDQHFRG
jgi:hypothetical protein